ncbi:MAG: 2-amino-4-hydroxy-6-hydroxymethyldihydropteridine diphosphokinase [Chloroflexi bacterium]|nr:2-amino-4-hydroxy-6-hydroxymethyldihydropteridine diphosphokinase [Chloroflexota bacterium]
MLTERPKPGPVKVYLGLGANLGDRQGNLLRAVELLSQWGQIEKLSSLYQTEPVGYLDQPPFLNAACQLTTTLTAEELLFVSKKIEAALGRIPSFLNAPRPIDIDILFYGEQVINSPGLTVPHPRLQERAFVLIPLDEIASDLVHPVSGLTVQEMTQRLGSLRRVTKWNQEANDV